MHTYDAEHSDCQIKNFANTNESHFAKFNAHPRLPAIDNSIMNCCNYNRN